MKSSRLVVLANTEKWGNRMERKTSTTIEKIDAAEVELVAKLLISLNAIPKFILNSDSIKGPLDDHILAYFRLIVRDHLARKNPIFVAKRDKKLLGLAMIRMPQNNPNRMLTFLLYWRMLKRFGRKALVNRLKYKSEINRYFPDAPFAYILHFGVLPSHVRKGLGRRLLSKAERLSISSEISTGLAIESTSLSNSNFLETTGFSRYDQVDIGGKQIGIYFRAHTPNTRIPEVK